MSNEASLKERLSGELKEAMKSGDTLKRDTLRMLLASVHNAEITKRGDLDDSDIIGIISKDVRRHQESIDAFRQGNRPDLQAREEREMALLQVYLPAQLTHDEIVAAAREVMAAVGAQGPADKGKVMQQLMPKLKGKAEGKEINEVVTSLLAN